MRYSVIASARVNGAVLRKFMGPDGKIVMQQISSEERWEYLRDDCVLTWVTIGDMESKL